MTSLQIGLIVAGVVLVAGVLAYNWLQERRVRRRIDAAFAPRRQRRRRAARRCPRRGRRVEPTLRRRPAPSRRRRAAPRRRRPAATVPTPSDGFEPPVDVVRRAERRCRRRRPPRRRRSPRASAPRRRAPPGDRRRAARCPPDPEIESIVTLQPRAAGRRRRARRRTARAPGQAAALVRPARRRARRGSCSPPIRRGEFAEVAACLLLADRTGAASAPLLDAFVRLVGEIAASIPAAFVAPNAAAEAERAEALDRICADLDVQIGLTLLKTEPATIPGTRLRGVAEAAGFRLAGGGRFEWLQEETGAMLYALQNYRSEPFTADSAAPDVDPGRGAAARRARASRDPARVFDQMKLDAKRMAQTLDATLVDDNRRPLDDAALAAIRQQVAGHGRGAARGPDRAGQPARAGAVRRLSVAARLPSAGDARRTGAVPPGRRPRARRGAATRDRRAQPSLLRARRADRQRRRVRRAVPRAAGARGRASGAG